MQNDHVIFGIHINNRSENATKVQQLLTDYGCSIKTRIGLPEADKSFCSPTGLILREMLDDDAVVEELSGKLTAIEGVEVKRMIFDHP